MGLHILVSIEISNVCNEILVNAMLTIGTTDTALLHTSMEALDGLEVLAVDVGLAKLQLAAGLYSNIQILGEDARSQTVFAVISLSDGIVDGIEFNERMTGPKVSSWMMSIS